MKEFLAMGGYAAYVWTAYAAAAIGLAGLGLASWRCMRDLEGRAERLRAARRAERGQA